MGKLAVRGLIGLGVIIGLVYVLVPSQANKTQNTQTNKPATSYVGLGSKVTQSSSTSNIPNGFTVKVSPQATQSGILQNFESELQQKYSGDGNVDLYIAQATGSVGGPEVVTYDVNINGKQYMNLTATRNVNRVGFSDNINMSNIVYGSNSNINNQ
ncbi:MAG: hypothetical protein ACRC57_14165 [Sarcina sp.]